MTPFLFLMGVSSFALCFCVTLFGGCHLSLKLPERIAFPLAFGLLLAVGWFGFLMGVYHAGGHIVVRHPEEAVVAPDGGPRA